MNELLTLFVIGFVAAGTPGPDILLIIRTAIFKNKKDSFHVLLGIVTGNIMILSLVYFGLGFIGSSEIFKFVVQGVGGVYLLYIAYQIFIHRNDSLEIKEENISVGFKDGLIINLSNPKAILFFTVILTPFLDGEFLELKIISLQLGIVSVFLITIFLADKLKHKLVSPKVVKGIDLFATFIFIFFSITMIFDVLL